MFGRRRRQAAKALEAERAALFARLAQRPDHICPFLGLAGERTAYLDGVSDEHRCYAYGDKAPLSAEQQTRVCQQRGYGNCPRYLRGVLVIPTEELTALRRPAAGSPRPMAPPPPVRRQPSRLGSFMLAVLVLMLFGIAGTGAAYLAMSGGGPLFAGGPTESATPTARPSPTPSQGPSPTPEPTPVVAPSPGDALPTPGPDDEFTGYIVVVEAGEYPVREIERDGTLIRETRTVFDRRSGAPVERVVVDGTIHWRTSAGNYTGMAYVDGLSGDFVIYETYESADGESRFAVVPDEER